MSNFSQKIGGAKFLLNSSPSRGFQCWKRPHHCARDLFLPDWTLCLLEATRSDPQRDFLKYPIKKMGKIPIATEQTTKKWTFEL